MKVKDLRLHYSTWNDIQAIRVLDQNDLWMFTIRWGKQYGRTKRQALAIAECLCDGFNEGQEKP